MATRAAIAIAEAERLKRQTEALEDTRDAAMRSVSAMEKNEGKLTALVEKAQETADRIQAMVDQVKALVDRLERAVSAAQPANKPNQPKGT